MHFLWYFCFFYRQNLHIWEICCTFAAAFRKKVTWCYRLAVRTKDSQSLNRGSIPRSTTKKSPKLFFFAFMATILYFYADLFANVEYFS